MRVTPIRLSIVLTRVWSIRQSCEVVTDLVAAKIYAGMKPGLRVNGRHERKRIEIACICKCFVVRHTADFFSVPLLNHAEATDFAISPVEITVMVSVP